MHIFCTFFSKSFGGFKILPTFALAIQQWWIHLRARIPASHAGHRGSNPLSTTKPRPLFKRSFSFVADRGFGQSVASRATNLRWLLFAVANICLCQMIVFKNKFSAIIRQSQQSPIATALLRSPLNFSDRSNLL